MKKSLFSLLIPLAVLTLAVFVVVPGNAGAQATSTPSITVLSPNGGESLSKGTNFLIKWSQPQSAYVDIRLQEILPNCSDLITDCHRPLYNIAKNKSYPIGSNDYTWVVGNVLDDATLDGTIKNYIVPNGTYKIEVCYWTDTNKGCGSSDNYFNIVNTPPTPCYTFTTNLRAGDSGNDVAALQKFLIAKGFDIPAISSGKVDPGYFGLATARALGNYQISVGIFEKLYGNPYFGPLTRRSVNSLCGNQSGPTIDLTSNGIETKPANYSVDYRVTFDGKKYDFADVTLEFSCKSDTITWTSIFPALEKPNNTCTNRPDFNTGIDMTRYGDGDYRATITYYNASNQLQDVLVTAKAWGGVDGKTLITSDKDAITLPPLGSTSTTPSITVLSPNGGETYKTGDVATIKWESKGVSTDVVKIELGYVHNDSTYKAGTYVEDWIIEKAPNTGLYNWKVPEYYATGAVDGSFRVKVSNASGSDYSNSQFKIIKGSSSANITVTKPAIDSGYYKGETLPISWIADGKDSYGVALLRKNDSSFLRIIMNTQGISPNLTWQIPNDIPDAYDYFIKINEGVYRNKTGYSSAFAIKANGSTQPCSIGPSPWSPTAPQRLFNVDFGKWIQDGKTSRYTGPAIVGSSGDIWNVTGVPWCDGHNKTGLKNADGTQSQIVVQMSNLGGSWGNGSGVGVSNDMLSDFSYPAGNKGGNAYVTLSNAPAGNYDLYLYNKTGNASQNGDYTVSVGSRSYGHKVMTTDTDSSAVTFWQENNQFVVFRNIQVNSGEAITVLIQPSVGGLHDAQISGLQLAPTGTPAAVVYTQYQGKTIIPPPPPQPVEIKTPTITTPVTPTLTVTTSGDGEVRTSDGKYSCGGVCALPYSAGTRLTLSPMANKGSNFTGWSGGLCSGTGSCTITLNSDASVSATFAPIPTMASPTISSFTASPSSIATGQYTTLSWSSVNASDCIIFGGGSTPVSGLSASGSRTVGPLSTASTYTLYCNGSNGQRAQATASVNVVSPEAPAKTAPTNTTAVWDSLSKFFGW